MTEKDKEIQELRIENEKLKLETRNMEQAIRELVDTNDTLERDLIRAKTMLADARWFIFTLPGGLLPDYVDTAASGYVLDMCIKAAKKLEWDVEVVQ